MSYERHVLPVEIGRAIREAHGFVPNDSAACAIADSLAHGVCPPSIDPAIAGDAIRAALGTDIIGDPPASRTLIRESRPHSRPPQRRSAPAPRAAAAHSTVSALGDADAGASFSVQLTPAQARALRGAARAAGVTPEEYAAAAIVRALGRAG